MDANLQTARKQNRNLGQVAGRSLAAQVRRFVAQRGLEPTVINTCGCGRRISANKEQCFACSADATPKAA
jgi:hypothetical protein